MRIKCVEDLENSMNAKVFYITRIPDTIESFDRFPESVHDLRSVCHVYPCTLEKHVNDELAGFRMDESGKSGRSFECAGSVRYVFKPIVSKKQCKKLKVDPTYYNDSLDDGIFEYEHANFEWNGISTYTDVSIYDGTFEKSYTVNSLVSADEYKGNAQGIVFIEQSRVFTEAHEAVSHVICAATSLANGMIEYINKQAEHEKELYYRFKHCVERGKLY